MISPSNLARLECEEKDSNYSRKMRVVMVFWSYSQLWDEVDEPENVYGDGCIRKTFVSFRF